ncbi:MAG: transposase family protein, partial [Cytophagaceae bacterium]
MALAPDGNIVMHKALHPSSFIPAGFAMVSTSSDDDRTTITVRSISRSSCCPTCGTDSHRVHSRYQRRIADLPRAGKSVRLIAEVCCFRCAATQCEQQIFTEQFPTGVLAPWVRRTGRTGRLDVLVHHLGLALGGRPAASLAKRLMLPVSNDTLLR